jgi:predicted transcriptional regulator
MRISPAEYEVMKALWTSAPQSAAELAEALGPKKGWSDRTVKTLLARLVEKKALSTQTEGRRYLYSPLVAREDYERRAAGQFVQRMFGGRAAPLVAHLAETGSLTQQDISELEALLEDLKNDR